MDEQKAGNREEDNNQKKYAFFPGCLIPIRLPLFEKLSRDFVTNLGVELIDMDFTCCPNYNIRDRNRFLWLVAAARNLAIAERGKLDILTLCGECTQTLKAANELLKDKILLLKVNKELEKINVQYNGTVKIKHILELFYESKEKLTGFVKKPLEALKVSTHTGCHLLRPSAMLKFDDAENPKKLDELSSILGCQVIDYSTKTLCCGVAVFADYKDSVLESVKEKINDIRADALIVGCATCFLQYNKAQLILKTDLPVLHYIQLLGLANGFSLEEIGYNSINRIKNKAFEEKLNITVP
ncbi:CoB--CoM heterodisulfide reductase iron-sulfur subunit B family protein [Candidatus Woesearchaeota archaeon]|nr:CoB--CoM heterodisulfide reductase iron-sulfur subunit B family protein [Candidatus Woesearchaeota archaeon]